MLFVMLHALLALPLVAAAPLSALGVRDPGPSGYVISPAGGHTGPPGAPVYFEYQPVFLSENTVGTAYVDLDVYNIDTDQTWPLARGLTAPHADYWAFQVIQATFSFVFGPIGGTDLQLIVTEYQVGENPPYSFRSAAPSFNLEDSPPTVSPISAAPLGTVALPTNGTSITSGNAFTVLYQPGPIGEGPDVVSVDVDVQDASADPGDGSSYSVVGHNLSQGIALGIQYAIVADFKAIFGCGLKRLRFTEYSVTYPKEGSGTVYVAYQYVNINVTGC